MYKQINFIELNDLPILDLYTEFNRLLDNNTIKWFDYSNDQLCINTIPSKPDDIHLGRGSLIYDWDNADVDGSGNVINLNVKEITLEEDSFTMLASPFKGTLFEQVYNALNKKYHLGRVRIINAKSKTCLSWHSDSTLRVHYPLKTQEGCMMIIEDEIKILEKNKWYLTNTLKNHTAINSSIETRLHLVAVIIGER